MDKEIYKITKLEIQKKNKNRISIYINGTYALGVDKKIATLHGLMEGKVIDKEELKKTIRDEEQNKANNYAISLLSYRSRSEKEIENKMKGKGYDLDIIEDTLNFLRKYNYINDKNFAHEFTMEKSKKYGRKRIKIELGQKGISDNIVDNVIDNIDEGGEYDLALELANKKMKSYINDDRKAVYRKLGAFLGRRGFDYDIIRNVINKVLDKNQ